jgi:hypothetical protein
VSRYVIIKGYMTGCCEMLAICRIREIGLNIRLEVLNYCYSRSLTKSRVCEQIIGPPYLRASKSVPHVLWVSCHHTMAHAQIADRDDLQTWMVPANILNKQLRTAGEGWSSNSKDEHCANILPKDISLL